MAEIINIGQGQKGLKVMWRGKQQQHIERRNVEQE
jgi:hypothetical protein